MGFSGYFFANKNKQSIPRPLVWVFLNHSLEDYELGQLTRLMNMDFSVCTHMIPPSLGTGNAMSIPDVQACTQTQLQRLSPEVIAQGQLHVVYADFLETELSAYLLYLQNGLQEQEGELRMSIFQSKNDEQLIIGGHGVNNGRRPALFYHRKSALGIYLFPVITTIHTIFVFKNFFPQEPT